MFRSFFRVSSELSVIRRYLVSDAGRTSSTPTPTPQIPRLSFSEVRKELEHKDTFLLDVREKGELSSDGKINGAHNIPLGEVETAIQLNEEQFKARYGFDKPPPGEKNVIVHCKLGVRAMKAALVLSAAGYSPKVYDGIADWISNGGEVIK